MNFMRSVPCIPLLAAAAILACGCASIESPMTDERFGTVRPGMTNDEVRLALGAPRQTMMFPKSSTQSWDYLGTDAWGYMVDYSVIFGPDGLVTSKVARRINNGGDHGT